MNSELASTVIKVAALTLAIAITAAAVTCWTWDRILLPLGRRIRYEHRQRIARVRRYQTAERIGRHRAMWSAPLDDQPAEIILAVATDVQRRRRA